MANGLDKISLRIPAQWDPEWFRMVIRDVLSKADVRNAIGSGVAITGNTDEPATLAVGTVNLATGVTGVLAAANIDSAIARDSEVSAAITAHEGASDPHPGYTTAAELAAAVAPVVTTVGALPASHGNFPRYFVTDATAPTFLAIVAGGGAVRTPVWWNGTNWIVG
jgi:hypothetical protein